MPVETWLGTMKYDALGRRVAKITATQSRSYFYDLKGRLMSVIHNASNSVLNSSNNPGFSGEIYFNGQHVGVWPTAPAASAAISLTISPLLSVRRGNHFDGERRAEVRGNWCLLSNHVHLIAVPLRHDSLSVLLRRVHQTPGRLRQK